MLVEKTNFARKITILSDFMEKSDADLIKQSIDTILKEKDIDATCFVNTKSKGSYVNILGSSEAIKEIGLKIDRSTASDFFNGTELER